MAKCQYAIYRKKDDLILKLLDVVKYPNFGSHLNQLARTVSVDIYTLDIHIKSNEL